jgi:hypothetical protein
MVAAIAESGLNRSPARIADPPARGLFVNRLPAAQSTEEC